MKQMHIIIFQTIVTCISKYPEIDTVVIRWPSRDLLTCGLEQERHMVSPAAVCAMKWR